MSNRKNSSVIVPKAQWNGVQKQLKAMERELIQQEMDAVLRRNETAFSHKEVEQEIMEIINAKLGG